MALYLSSGESSEKKPGPLEVQPHGGAIRRGNAGNRGGTGAPSSRLRARMRGKLAQRYQVAAEIADGELRVPVVYACEHCGKEPTEKLGLLDYLKLVVSPSDRVRALDFLAKYGLGTRSEVEVDEKLELTVRVLHE